MRMLDAFFQAPKTAMLIFRGTSKQMAAAVKLYSVLVCRREIFQEGVVLNAVHNFLVSLAKPGELPTCAIACPSDQFLCFRDIRRGDIPRRQSALCSDCAVLRFCIKSILFHDARLIHEKISTFQWFQQPESYDICSDSSEGSEDQQDNGDSGVFDDDDWEPIIKQGYGEYTNLLRAQGGKNS